MKKIESRLPLGSLICLIQKKPGSLPLAAFLLSKNKKTKIAGSHFKCEPLKVFLFTWRITLSPLHLAKAEAITFSRVKIFH